MVCSMSTRTASDVWRNWAPTPRSVERLLRPPDPHQRLRPDDAAPRGLQPARAGPGGHRPRRDRSRRRRPGPALHRAVPPAPAALRARLHVRRTQGMIANLTTTTIAVATPVVPSHGALRPLGLDEVRITGGVWADRQAVNGGATLAHIEYWMEHEGWIGNFDAAAAGTVAEHRAGREFSDSEVYKLLEAMAWEVGRDNARATATSSGVTSCTASATCSRLPSRGCAPGRTRPTASSTSPSAPPTTCVRRSASTACTGCAVTPRSSRRSPSWVARPASRATSSRLPCSSPAAGRAP